MNTNLHPIRWGVLGAARIAAKVAEAIRNTEGAALTAVASRCGQRAAEWADLHQVEHSYEGYQQVLDDPQIDAVYIPLPPSLHAEWTIRAAEAGKHVLCEKPIAMNAAEAGRMADACRNNHRQLMDATMWVHHPRTVDMARVIQEGELGEMRRVTSGFSFLLERYLRDNAPTGFQATDAKASLMEQAVDQELRLQRHLGGGALMDLGWYCVRATLWAFGELPLKAFGTARYWNDVDVNFSGLLWFGDDRMASFDVGFDQAHRKWFEVVGVSGSLVCDDFVNPWKADGPRFWVHDANAQATAHRSASANQIELMIARFCSIARSGDLEDYWPEQSIATQRVCEALDHSARRGSVVEV